ncbi:MAG: heme-binding protein [Synechococcus sp. ELA057]
MRNAPLLELADARRIAGAAHAEADRHGAAVTVALVDGGGHPLLLERRDGGSPASAAAALGKARMAAINGKATADQEAAINGPRPALLQLQGLLGEPAAAMAGGIPLLLDGHCLGGIGVSGMTPEIDTAIAAAGAAALGSTPTP